MNLQAGFTESESRYGFVIRVHFLTEPETRYSVNPNPDSRIEYALSNCMDYGQYQNCSLCQYFPIQTLLGRLSPYRFLPDTPTTSATSATNAALVQVIMSLVEHDTELNTSEW